MADQTLNPDNVRGTGDWQAKQGARPGQPVPPERRPGPQPGAQPARSADADAAAVALARQQGLDAGAHGSSPPATPKTKAEEPMEVDEAGVPTLAALVKRTMASLTPPPAPPATPAPPAPATAPPAPQTEEQRAKAKAAEADAIFKTTMLLNADRVGLNRKSVMLDALRSAQDIEAVKRIFLERTGKPLQEFLGDQLGDEKDEKKKGLDQKEAEALLSGDKKSSVLAAIDNCGKRNDDKLKSILASVRGDPNLSDAQKEELIREASVHWASTKGMDSMEDRLSPAEKSFLVEGKVGEAKGHEMRDARGVFTDEKAIEGLLRSAKDGKERDEMLLVYAKTKNPAITDAKEALAFFEKDASKFSSKEELDVMVALAKGDEAGAAAASMQRAMKSGDFEGMNEALASGPNPNEPGISPEEKQQRLKDHQKRLKEMEEAYKAKYAKDDPRPASEVMADGIAKAAEKGKDPELEKKRLEASRGEGGMNFGLQAEYVVSKGDVDGVRDLMRGLDAEGINQLDKFLKEQCGGKSLADVINKTSGREKKALMRDYLYGAAPSTDEDKIEKAKAIHADELGKGEKGVAGGLATAMSGADDRMGKNLSEIEALEKKKKDGTLTDEDRAKLDRTLAYMEGDAEGFREDKDTVTRGAKLVGKGVVALGVGAATGGAGLPAWAAALATGAAGESTAMLLQRAVQGTDYGGNQAKKDAIAALFKVGAGGVAGGVTEAATHALGAVGGGAVVGGGQKIAEVTGQKIGQAAAGEDTGGAKGVAADLGKGILEGVAGGAVGGEAGELAKKPLERVPEGLGREALGHVAASGGKMAGQAAKRKATGEDAKEGAEEDAADEFGAVFAPG